MKCLLVFDHLNDILFFKSDKKFLNHITKLAISQGLDFDQSKDEECAANFLIQLFAPLVTSQRVMSSQFGNSYRSIQCDDDTNVVFDEYMGYLFLCLGFDEIYWLKRTLCISMSIIQHICGADISILKYDTMKASLVSRLIDTWSTLVLHDQSVLVEAIEQLTVNNDLSRAAMSVLSEATDKMKSELDCLKSHAILFVQNKFLALYSSKNALELNASDILFLSLLVEGLRMPVSRENGLNPSFRCFYFDYSSEEEFFSAQASTNHSSENNSSAGNSELSEKADVFGDTILLSHGGLSAVVPHIAYVCPVASQTALVLLHQRCNEHLGMHLHESMEAASAIHCTASDAESLKRNWDRLDQSLKKLFDQLKKLKSADVSPSVDTTAKMLHAKWDSVKKQAKEGGGAERNVSGIVVLLREVLHSTAVMDCYGSVRKQAPGIGAITSAVQAGLAPFTSALSLSALVANSLQGSRASLSINKYLEEFPALVHFMHIDRTNHRITAPSIDFDASETVQATRRKIWGMVEFSRTHLQEGHLVLIWKDLTFNYGYYLWFEDSNGSPIKPKVSSAIVVKSLSIPGVISGNFYERLVEGCFPKSGSGKVRCMELYTVHLGQVTSQLALDHGRRLAATIWEVTGLPHNPLDLL